VSKFSQGVTGLETTKIVPDDRLEKHANEVDTFDSSEDDGDTSDSDESDYGGYSVATKEDYVPVEIKDKKKTKGGKSGEIIASEQSPNLDIVPGQDGWNQQQQKALESALQQFPKGTSERWDRISAKVSGKSKEECMLRVRYLAEIVKKKKDCGEQAAT
jgi:DnaJ family protein C protein 1